MTLENTHKTQSDEQQFNPIATETSLSLNSVGKSQSKRGIQGSAVALDTASVSFPVKTSSLKPDVLKTVTNYLATNLFELKHQNILNKNSLLVVFLIDSSSSMARNKMIGCVKGLVQKTMTKYAGKKIKYAVVTLVNGQAEITSLPDTSVDQLNFGLENLKTGGQTNMVAGIRKVYEVIRNKGFKENTNLFILTDGKINKGETANPFDDAVRIYKQLLGSLDSTVIDPESGFVQLKMAEKFANRINAKYKKMEVL